MKKKLLFIIFFLVLSFFVSSCSKEPADYLEKGIKDFESENYDSAIANLRRAKYLIPESFKANLYLGKCFLKATGLKDAEYKARYYLNTAKELTKTSEDRFHISLSLLSIYEKQQDYSKINKECKYLIEKNKELLDKSGASALYTMLADSFFNLDEYKEAAETYEYTIKNFKEELAKNQEAMAKTYIQLGAAVVKSDKAREAEGLSYANIAQKIEKDTFSDEYRLSAAKCYVVIGDHFYHKKAYGDSKAYYLKALANYDHLKDSKQASAISGKIEKATIEIDNLCENYDCLMRKGERKLSEMDYDNAAGYFKKAEQQGNNNFEKAEAISKSGISSFLDGDEEDALSRFKILKNEYGKEYGKSVDKDRVDLFMGASMILTSKNPDTLTSKLIEKASGLFSTTDKDEISVFKDNIDSGKKLIESSMNNITEKTPAKTLREIAVVCEAIGDRFEQWEMKGDATKFYQKASHYYGSLFEKEKVVDLNKKIRTLN